MKQQISVLMDGELFDDEAEALLDKLKRNPDVCEEWQAYHLIGDVLRQPDHACCNISAAMRERLQAEPTVFAPRRQTRQKAKWFALSAAASVMALALVAWMSVQVGSEPPPQIAMQHSTVLRPASFSGNNGLNNYLMAHQEYAPSANMQGAASYIRTVADQ